MTRTPCSISCSQVNQLIAEIVQSSNIKNKHVFLTHNAHIEFLSPAEGCEFDILCDRLPHPYPWEIGLSSPTDKALSSCKNAASSRLENGHLENTWLLVFQVRMSV